MCALGCRYIKQYGLHHWWLDCDEPCGGTNNGSFANNWLYDKAKAPAALVGAAYPSMVAQMIYEGEGAPGKVSRCCNNVAILVSTRGCVFTASSRITSRQVCDPLYSTSLWHHHTLSTFFLILFFITFLVLILFLRAWLMGVPGACMPTGVRQGQCHAVSSSVGGKPKVRCRGVVGRHAIDMGGL